MVELAGHLQYFGKDWDAIVDAVDNGVIDGGDVKWIAPRVQREVRYTEPSREDLAARELSNQLREAAKQRNYEAYLKRTRGAQGIEIHQTAA